MSLLSCGKKCLSFFFGCLIFAGIGFGISSYIQLYLQKDVMIDFYSDYFDIPEKDAKEILNILVKYRDKNKEIMRLEKLSKETSNLRDVTDDISFKKIKNLQEIQKLIAKQKSNINKIISLLDKQDKDIQESIELIKEANRKFNEAYEENMKLLEEERD